GYAATVVERSRYEDFRVGETLAPAVQSPLVALGLWERFLVDAHAPSFGIRSAWGRPALDDNDHLFNPYGLGWHVNRARFDALLARAAEEAGVGVHRGTRLRRCERGPRGGWVVDADDGTSAHRLFGKVLVDATGRRTSVAPTRAVRRVRYDRLVGVVG